MTDKYAFFHILNLDFEKIDGVICSIVVSYQDEKGKSTLDRLIDSKLERAIYSATRTKRTSLFNFVRNNLAEAERVSEWIHDLDGVAKTRMGVIKQYILETEWLDSELRSMLSKS